MAGKTRLPTPKMPFHWVIGQDELKLALKLAYIAPRLGGVLISGQRGTGKSTAVRAFARLVYGGPEGGAAPRPTIVTLPINATEDRVVGGWKIEALMRGTPEEQSGLLEDAHERILYVDEVNLLDDHIVNIILDVASTGVLSIQREGRSKETTVEFLLVGTMNPEEGNLRPQLLDRFGLMVNITAEPDSRLRQGILKSVIAFDRARKLAGEGEQSPPLLEALGADRRERERLDQARERYYGVDEAPGVKLCIDVAQAFKMQGHRGDLVLLTASRAMAALCGHPAIGPEHVRAVAHMALQHRRQEASQGMFYWQPATHGPDGAIVDHGDDGVVCRQLGLDAAAPPLREPAV